MNETFSNKIDNLLNCLNDNINLFNECRKSEINETVLNGDIYYQVEEILGTDFEGFPVIGQVVFSKTKSVVNDYAVLFLHGRRVRLSKLEKVAPNAALILRTKVLTVPAYEFGTL